MLTDDKIDTMFCNSFLQTFLEPIVIISKDYKIIFMNEAAKKINPEGNSCMSGILCDKVGHDRNCDRKNCKVRLVSRLGYSIKTLYHNIQDDEDVFWEISGIPLRDENESISAVMFQFHDITEHKRLARELENSLLLLGATIESTVDGILVFDLEDNMISVNKKFQEIFCLKDNFRGFKNKREVFHFMEKYINNSNFYSKMMAIDLDFTSEYNEILYFVDGRVIDFYSKPRKVGNKNVGRLWSFNDITLQKTTEKKLEHLAHFDSLTNLPNRMLFFDRLGQVIINAKRYEYKFALMFLDLDRFKIVNDSLGHNVGDELLKEFSKRLKECLRESDTVARMGGDEFTVILSRISNDNQDIEIVANKIIESLERPFELGEHECSVGVSIGISTFPNDGDSIELLMRNADMAMYNAKEQGKNNYRFYIPVMNGESYNRLRMENDLRSAIKKDEFILYYQPQINIRTGRIIGMEALIRWKHPTQGMVSPAQFIPIAEESGLIIPIGEWVLKTACRDTKKLHDEGYDFLRVAVNLSGVQFKEKKLLSTIDKIIEETNFNAEFLELELTESIAMQNVESTINIMNEITDKKIFLSIDDFGTGYSSLSYLKKYPIDKLKIDQSFVRDIVTDQDDKIIVETIIAMAHSLKLNVIAEGVETGEQLEFLNTLGCDEVQGYLFGKPMPLELFVRLLNEKSYFSILELFAGKTMS